MMKSHVATLSFVPNASEHRALARVEAPAVQPPVPRGSDDSTQQVEVARQHATPPTRSELVFLSDPDSSTAASYRILRERLKGAGDPRVMLVTSAREGEGKTTCSINLSMALAENGRARVLLLEASMRRPGLATTLGFEPPACLAEQLAARARKAEGPWKVTSCFSPHLHVLAVAPAAAGKWLLNGYGFSSALAELRRVYDYVIVDAPATLGSADVNVVQDAADGVVFAALARRTSSADLRAAARQLAPCRALGVVLLEA
jgi:succinoglycan biosynthesis transport protein ExoP